MSCSSDYILSQKELQKYKLYCSHLQRVVAYPVFSSEKVTTVLKARISRRHQLRSCKSQPFWSDMMMDRKLLEVHYHVWEFLLVWNLNTSTDMEDLRFSLHACLFLLVHREERGQEMKEKASSFLNFKTEFLSRCVCFLLQTGPAPPPLQRGSKQIDEAPSWTYSRSLADYWIFEGPGHPWGEYKEWRISSWRRAVLSHWLFLTPEDVHHVWSHFRVQGRGPGVLLQDPGWRDYSKMPWRIGQQ